MTDFIRTRSITITGYGEDQVEAYFAGPDPEHDASPRGGLVLIHHMPGFDRWTKEVARRFATDGYNVLAPNLYYREAPDASPDDAAAAARAQGGVPDHRLVGDVAAAADYLRGMPSSNGKVAVMGHCSGGRQAVLAGCNLTVDAVVDCYGAWVVGTPPADTPMGKLGVTGFEDDLVNLTAPLLGLFGREDKSPSPEHVELLDQLLTKHGKPHEFHSYDSAGHAFFAADRPSYRQQAATDAYEKLGRFLTTHLG
jgi:carboxymethylenebutenolidase